MKISKCNFFVSTIITLGLLFTGCSDNESNPGNPLPTDGVNDVTLGYNSIIMDIDNLTSIPLHNDAEVTLSNDNPNVEFFVEKLGDRQVITPSFKQPIENIAKPFTTKVNVKVNNTESSLSDKDIYVSFRRKANSEAKDSDVNYARAIGKGTKPWGDMGNVTYPILSFDDIYSELSLNENLTDESIFFETSGEKYISSLEYISASVGLSGTIPVEGALLSGSAAYGYDKSETKSNAYEYYIGYYGKSMSEVKLNPDWIIARTEELLALLDPTANDALNNQASAVYQNYPNTKEGIYKLLDNYGTHVITKAVFGGNYITLYAREENAYETTVGHDASVAISGTTKLSTGSQNWSQVYVDKTNSQAIEINASGSNYSSESELANKSFHIITVKGGNACVDMTSWDESVNAESRDSWIPISYLTKDANDDEDNGLIPISKFIVDKDRQEAVETYLEEYYNEHCVTLKDSPMVIVDFMMKTGSNDHKNGEPASFVAKDPTGVYRHYYPMMANKNAPVDDGYAIETSQSDYVVASDNNDHYWYYALGHVDENAGFYGITDVLFDDMDHDGYTKRGDNTNTGITGVLDENYVYLKYASKGTPQKQLITGIGLRETDNDKIIASTGGTEMVYPWGSDDSRFNNYWSDSNSYTTNIDKWFAGALVKNCNFKPAYTTKPLDVNFSFGNGNTKGHICHPKKWGEQ